MIRAQWISLSKEADARLEVKKSLFIAAASPIFSAQEARDKIEDARKRYPDATHHVYAWRIARNEVLQKYSDDKEPSGTAGLPVLDALRNHEIEDAIVVVTRYFGGTQLGTGGLARAYSESASAAIQKAVPSIFAKAARYEIEVAFSLFDRMRYILEKEGFHIADVLYREKPIIHVLCPTTDAERLSKICSDNSSGRSMPVFLEDAEMIIKKVGT